MRSLTPDQRRRRARFERAIGIAAPGLNLLLAVGERLASLQQRGHERAPLAPAPADDGPVRRAMRRGVGRATDG